MEITDDQRIAILVYHEDHPEAYAPEISTALDLNYREVVHTLREHKASKSVFRVSFEVPSEAAAGIWKDHIEQGTPVLDVKIRDMTPCASLMRHGPGHQSQTYCEQTGPHETHGAIIMGMWTEWDKEGEEA